MLAKACARLPGESRRWGIGRGNAFLLTWLAYTIITSGRMPFAIAKTALCPTDADGKVKLHQGWAPFDTAGGKELLGVLDTCFMATYALGMPLMGVLADRLDRGRFLASSLVATGACLALFGLGHAWGIHSMAYFAAVTAACGLVQSAAFPCTTGIMPLWFRKERMGWTMGIFSSSSPVGNIVGKVLCAASLQRWGWPSVFFAPSLALWITGLLVLLLLVHDPHHLGLPRVDEHREDAPLEQGLGGAAGARERLREEEELPLRRILALPSLLCYSLATLLAKLVYYGFSNWLPFFLASKVDMPQDTASYLSSLFDWGGFVGVVLGGWLSDRFGSRGVVCVCFQFLSCPCMLAYILLVHRLSLMSNAAALFILGMFVSTPYNLITCVATIDLGRHPMLRGNTKAVSTVTGIIDGCGSVGAATQGLLVGAVSTLLGWNWTFYVLSAVSLLSGAMMLPPARTELWERRLSVAACGGDCRHLES